jgi:hypothetical protein
MTSTDEFKQSTLLFPLRELNAEGLKAYADFESLAIQCLESIPFAKTEAASIGAGMTWDEFRYRLGSPDWPEWVTQDADVRIAMMRWLRSIVKRLPGQFQKAPKTSQGFSRACRRTSGTRKTMA